MTNLYPFSARPVFYTPTNLGSNPLAPTNLPQPSTGATGVNNPLYRYAYGSNLEGNPEGTTGNNGAVDGDGLSVPSLSQGLQQVSTLNDVFGLIGEIGVPTPATALFGLMGKFSEAGLKGNLNSKMAAINAIAPALSLAEINAANKGTAAGGIDDAVNAAAPEVELAEMQAQQAAEAQAAAESTEHNPGTTPSLSAPAQDLADAQAAAAASAAAAAESTEASGGGDGGDGKVICTELRRQGLLPDHIWRADEEYAKTVSPEVRTGYLLWALPWVQVMRSSEAATRFTYLFARPWAQHMAYTMGAESEDSRAGRIIMRIGGSICGFLGSIVRRRGNPSFSN